MRKAPPRMAGSRVPISFASSTRRRHNTAETARIRAPDIAPPRLGKSFYRVEPRVFFFCIGAGPTDSRIVTLTGNSRKISHVVP